MKPSLNIHIYIYIYRLYYLYLCYLYLYDLCLYYQYLYCLYLYYLYMYYLYLYYLSLCYQYLCLCNHPEVDSIWTIFGKYYGSFKDHAQSKPYSIAGAWGGCSWSDQHLQSSCNAIQDAGGSTMVVRRCLVGQEMPLWRVLYGFFRSTLDPLQRNPNSLHDSCWILLGSMTGLSKHLMSTLHLHIYQPFKCPFEGSPVVY